MESDPLFHAQFVVNGPRSLVSNYVSILSILVKVAFFLQLTMAGLPVCRYFSIRCTNVAIISVCLRGRVTSGSSSSNLSGNSSVLSLTQQMDFILPFLVDWNT